MKWYPMFSCRDVWVKLQSICDGHVVGGIFNRLYGHSRNMVPHATHWLEGHVSYNG